MWSGRRGGRGHHQGFPVAQSGHRRDHGHHNSIVALAEGESATILDVAGGGRMAARLANMGLRPGKTVTKRGALPGRGPVTVEVDGCQVALGHGIACKVFVGRSGEQSVGQPGDLS